MSERTTIGGTVYESIGSSSSNLLLKCNGTARIQWGNKLIDLIKNGKISSGDSQELVFIVQDESEIVSDGIYVLTTEESDKLLIIKNGNRYDLTGNDLYISASKKQNFTSEQKKQALDNIGIYYETLEDLKKANIQTGIVYVIENKTLYTVKNGQIEEFEAKLKTITVNETFEEGVKIINSPVKIILSILDEEYLVLADQRITANYSIHVKDSAQIGSENADKTQGYRLYIEGGTSWLDVDEINVRNGIKVSQYKEVTYTQFKELLDSNNLEAHIWYLITDFQNHWRLVKQNKDYDRPILVRALTTSSLYEWGYLFRDHRIKIKYDPKFEETITQTVIIDEVETEKDVKTRGRITWMLDTRNNNQANFDFMDYKDGNDEELAFLHKIYNDASEDKSIFPYKSHDNKLVVYNLKGTVLIDGKINDDNANEVNFMYDDIHQDDPFDATNPIEVQYMQMYNNDIVCRGLVVQPSCNMFYNNTLTKIIKLEVQSDFCNNNMNLVYSREDFVNLREDIPFDSLEGDSLYSVVTIYKKFDNVSCLEMRHCIFNDSIINTNFGIIENSIFNKIISNSSIISVKRPDTYYLYDFNIITNSTIVNILQGVSFNNEINNSYINTISDNSQIFGKITNCNIQKIIEETVIYGELVDSNITEMSSQIRIFGNIKSSTINKITNGISIKGIINNSHILDILSDIPEICIINDSNIGIISENCTINSQNISETSIENIENSIIIGELIKSRFKNISNSQLNSNISNCNFNDINTTIIEGQLNDSTFGDILNSNINATISNSFFNNLIQVILNSSFNNVRFKNIYDSTFGEGIIIDTVSFYDLSESFDQETYPLLYIEKRKEIYIHNEKINIICIPDSIFYRGMIIMHSGLEPIPKGWAICDGGEYEWDGIISTTPNLINRFIKAVATVDEIKETDNEDINDKGEFQLKEEHLPKHSHPHVEHTHTFSGNGSGTFSDSFTALTDYSTKRAITSVEGGISGYSGDDTTKSTVTVSGNVSVTVSGDTSAVVSTEEEKTWENKPIKPIPNYYSLIFIMKL